MKKQRILAGMIIAVVVILWIGYGIRNHTDISEKQPVQASRTSQYFGTIITITLYGENEEALNQAIEHSFSECDRLEHIFSARLEDSELSGLNASAYEEPVQTSEELMSLMKQALYYCELSEGRLDISIGQLIRLLGIGTDQEKVPKDSELEPLRGRQGYQAIRIDEEAGTIRYTDEQVEVDLGAIAKGYASDAVKKYLTEQEQVSCGILNFGGNVMTIGEKPDGKAWKIGITDPQSPNEICGTVSVKDQCVVTSGNYERYFVENGKRYHHILNPFTGYPAEEGVISASILGDDAADCDALSTICFNMDAERALALVESLDGFECILIDENGEKHCSSGIRAYEFQEVR